VVIGAGGLGHVAIQILRALTSTTVIVLDVNEEKLQLASDVGAHHVFLSDNDAIDKIKALTGGKGAQAVFDIVVVQPTIDIGQAVLRVEGDLVLVGVGAGTTKAGVLASPYDSSVRAPYWGSRSELFEVLELAKSGAIHVETEVFSLDDAPKAYEKLHEGTLRGRAVIVP
jgi:propanol-preferring alcohol dehydrogenase